MATPNDEDARQNEFAFLLKVLSCCPGIDKKLLMDVAGICEFTFNMRLLLLG